MKFSDFQENLSRLLDRDMQLLSSKHRPPTEDELEAVKETGRLAVSDDYKTFLKQYGGTIIQVHESVWPRNIKGGPPWSPHFSVMIFGLGDQIPDFLHLGKVTKAYRKRYSDSPLYTPFLRLKQSSEYLLFRMDETIVKGKGKDLLEVQGGFFEVVLDYVRQLHERKEEMKSYVRARNAVRTTTKIVLPIPMEREESMEQEHKVLETPIEKPVDRVEEIAAVLDGLPYRDERAWQDLDWKLLRELDVPSALPILLRAAKRCGDGACLANILSKAGAILGDSADEQLLEETMSVVEEVFTLPRLQYFIAFDAATQLEQRVKLIRTLREIDVRSPSFEHVSGLADALSAGWRPWYSYFPPSFLMPLSRPEGLCVLVQIGNKCGFHPVLVEALNLLCTVITPTTSDAKLEEVKKMTVRVRSRWIDCGGAQGEEREELEAALRRVEERSSRVAVLEGIRQEHNLLRYT